MLGQPMSMLIPQVLGFRLTGSLQEGATATDLVLTVTEMLRAKGVVGKFVEFYGDGLARLPLADRATIGNMSPEFGSTCAIFPIDAETLRYLEFSGRPPELIELVEAYAREQGLWHDEDSEEPTFSDRLELDLGTVVPSIAGPKRPQDRVSLTESKPAFRSALEGYLPDEDPEDEAIAESFPASDPVSTHVPNGVGHEPGSVPAAQVAERRGTRRPGHARGRDRDFPRSRARRDRRDHFVHQHVEPVGNARRRDPGAERGSAGVDGQAVGQDLAGAGVEGRDRVPRPRRPERVPRRARLQPRRVRVHDVHRQQRAAAGGDLGGGAGQRPRGRLGAVGQPQLRGPDQSRREDELPGLAAAVRRVRDRGDDGHRPVRGAARPGSPRRAACS